MLKHFERNWSAHATSKEMSCSPVVKELAGELKITEVAAQLLINRGYESVQSAREFLGKQTELLHDPFTMKDIEVGAKRLIAAAADKEKIVIYGDYHVDGVTSVSILYTYLKKLGADVSYYIPSRTGEGYGMSAGAIDKIAADGAKLIVTVDTGITAIAEAEYIKSLGIDLIVTDHHECHNEIPSAVAVINPRQPDCKYPFKELAGVGVVFKFLCAMEKCLCRGDSLADCVRRVASEYADLVAVGTVADVMPVKDENRLIVSLGLAMMERSPRLAISELLAAVNGDSGKYKSQKRITSGVIGFTIAPRINAAGRIKNASIAVELFLSENREKAARYAAELCEINRERQAQENAIIEAAYEKIEREHNFEDDPVIVLSDEGWHHGVIGIVASRITEKYKRPSILVSFEGNPEGMNDSDVGKGSGRSIKGMNLVEALTYCSDSLVKYGGHELAAGLTVTRENLPEFKKKINEYARNCFKDDDSEPSVVADIELSSDDVGMKAAKELYLFEPFGVSNPVPVFLMRNLTVTSAVNVGAGKHAKYTLRSSSGEDYCAMYFRRCVSDSDLFEGDAVDVLFNLDINSFQGKETLQFIVKDMTMSGAQLESEKEDREKFRQIISGTFDYSAVEEKDTYKYVPTRDEFAVLYNMLKREIRMGHEFFSIRALIKMLSDEGHFYSYIKLKVMLKVFQELNLLYVDEVDGEKEIYHFNYVYVKNKTDLDKSNLYRKIKANFTAKNHQ